MILFTLLAILVAASLFAIVRVMRDIAKDLRGMDESCKTTEERKNEKIRKEIETWRDGE